MVMGASVHPHPPYQDLQVVRFLHSVQFFGSILTSLHTDGHQQVNSLQAAGKAAQSAVRVDTERCAGLRGCAIRGTGIITIANKGIYRRRVVAFLGAVTPHLNGSGGLEV